MALVVVGVAVQGIVVGAALSRGGVPRGSCAGRAKPPGRRRKAASRPRRPHYPQIYVDLCGDSIPWFLMMLPGTPPHPCPGRFLLAPGKNSLRRIQSPERASRLVDLNIWGTLARRIGNEAFLRHAFPLLLTWLERGVVEVDGDACRGIMKRRRGDPSGRVQVAAAASISGEIFESLGERNTKWRQVLDTRLSEEMEAVL